MLFLSSFSFLGNMAIIADISILHFGRVHKGLLIPFLFIKFDPGIRNILRKNLNLIEWLLCNLHNLLWNSILHGNILCFSMENIAFSLSTTHYIVNYFKFSKFILSSCMKLTTDSLIIFHFSNAYSMLNKSSLSFFLVLNLKLVSEISISLAPLYCSRYYLE